MSGAERLSIIARAREIAADLMGTCLSMSEFAHEAEMDDLDFCRELDSHVELCESCGWWREPCDECCDGEDYE